MLIELLSTSNYVSYNIKLAEILGLHTAIYLSELMNINAKAIRKDKLDENKFTLQRDYIKSRTTLDENEQIDIENKLLKMGILEKGDSPNDMSVNINVLTTLAMSQDESLINNCKKIASTKSKRQSKEDSIKNAMKLCIQTNNKELREAYYLWIDAVYDRQGWLSKAAVMEAQSTIDKYSNRNLDIALNVLKIAAMNGYRDINWAINKMPQYNSPASFETPKSSPKQLSTEVF